VGYGEYPDGIGTELNQTGIGAQWASAANTPFHWWKAESYQGGTHSPFILSWPAGMKGREGSFIEQGTHIVDIAPTLLELARVAPSGKGAPIDGKSFAKALTDGRMPAVRPFFFEHYGARAVIDGQWKLVSLAPHGPAQPYRAWALYDLINDRTETRDLAAERPEIAARLAGEWQRWASSVGLEPRVEGGSGGGGSDSFSD
jgi:arylsulfatase